MGLQRRLKVEMNGLSDTDSSDVSDVESDADSGRHSHSHSERSVSEEETEALRNELTVLANRGLINKTKGQIKRMNHASMERIMQNYMINQTNSTTELVTKAIVKSGTGFLKSKGWIDDADEIQSDLLGNESFMSEMKTLVASVACYIPYLGLGLGALIVVNHMGKRVDNKVEETE